MKIAILADLHGNADALRALPEDADEVWVLGDLVNYGPEPGAVVAGLRARASVVVRGNHDAAVAAPGDAGWKPRWRETAEATRRFTASVLPPGDLAYLGGLPLQARVERGGATFHLVHATPSDPLYGHLAPGAPGWEAELRGTGADVLLVGHSHVPFIQPVGGAVVANPGSLGQPRNGDPRASYLLWEDGRLTLRTYAYPVEATVRKLQALAFPRAVETDLVALLRTGRP